MTLLAAPRPGEDGTSKVLPPSSALRRAGSPCQNSYCERVIGSTGRDCLDHVIAVSEKHLKWILRDDIDYYESLTGDADRVFRGDRLCSLAAIARSLALDPLTVQAVASRGAIATRTIHVVGTIEHAQAQGIATLGALSYQATTFNRHTHGVVQGDVRAKVSSTGNYVEETCVARGTVHSPWRGYPTWASYRSTGSSLCWAMREAKAET